MRWVGVLALAACAPVFAGDVVRAHYDDPTPRYAHGVLGDDIEYGTLVLTLSSGGETRITLPPSKVFEDTEPRLVDLDGDGAPEVIAVESDRDLGARLVVFGPDGEIAATPNIGRSFRWLAPLGAADLDGDGAVEIAYIDRPHLAKRLSIWRYENRSLTPVATADGLTNHRIGEADIAGGIRDCGTGPEIITANANWTRLMASTLGADGTVSTRDIAPHRGRASFAAALACTL